MVLSALTSVLGSTAPLEQSCAYTRGAGMTIYVYRYTHYSKNVKEEKYIHVLSAWIY